MLSAGKSWSGHYFLALRAVAVAVGCDQKQPLIQVELAEGAMLEEVPPQICLSAGSKVLRLPACRFEFLQ